jgi:hypothetical protein
MKTHTIIALAAAALAVTTALSTAAEARGMGGHFGGGGGFGRAHIGSSMRMSTFKAPSAKPAFKVHTFKSQTFKAVRSKPNFVKHDFRKVRSLVHKEPKILKHALKPKLDAHKLNTAKTLLKLKTNKMLAHKNMPGWLKPGAFKHVGVQHAAFKHGPAPKLTSFQLQKAMHFDFKGNKYSAMKKAWFDGKHWWKGALAWLFIDGIWYYGDEPWYEVDGVWTTQSGFTAECLDCEPVVVKKTYVSTLAEPSGSNGTGSATPSGASSGKSAPKSADATQPAGNDAKTKTTTPMSTEAVLIKSNTSEVEQPADQPTELATTTTTGTGPEVTPAPATKVAEAVIEPAPAATEAEAPAAADPAASPLVDCKRFVPAAGMTISVPCGK